MKKLLVLIIVAISVGNINGGNNVYSNNSTEFRNKYYYKGNIPTDELPTSIKEYLNKNYPDHNIMISKKKKDDKYYIKIRFNQNNNRSSYRDLVFDQNGRVIKG